MKREHDLIVQKQVKIYFKQQKHDSNFFVFEVI